MIRTLFISGLILIFGCITILIKGLVLMQTINQAKPVPKHDNQLRETLRTHKAKDNCAIRLKIPAMPIS